MTPKLRCCYTEVTGEHLFAKIMIKKDYLMCFQSHVKLTTITILPSLYFPSLVCKLAVTDSITGMRMEEVKFYVLAILMKSLHIFFYNTFSS